jgi:hypothetical protein
MQPRVNFSVARKPAAFVLPSLYQVAEIFSFSFILTDYHSDVSSIV